MVVSRLRTDHLSTLWSLTFLYTILFVLPRLATGSQHCLTVDQSLVECLNSTSTVFIECPPHYSLRIRSANVYKSASGCPSVPTPGSCWHSNVSDLVHRTCLRNESSCSLALMAPTSPLHCSPSVYAGDYFVVVDHRCQPVFTTDPATTTAFTIDISNPAIRTGALVRMTNNIFGGNLYVYWTSDYCSIHVPGNAQATVSVDTFDTTTASPDCQQRLQLSLWNSSQTFQLCRSTAPVTIDCDAHNIDRFFTLRYVTDDVSVGTLFFIDVQVSAWSAVTVQCGTPPVPLNISRPTTTTESPVTTTTTTTSTSTSPTTTMSTTTTPTTTTSTTTTSTSPTTTSSSSTASRTTSTSSPAAASTLTTRSRQRETTTTGNIITTTTSVDHSTVFTTPQSNFMQIAVIVSVTVVVAVIIISVTVGFVARRSRPRRLGVPTSKSPTSAMIVTRPRPSIYVYHGSYAPQLLTYPADDDHYKHVTDFYLGGGRRSSLVLGLQQPSPLYKNVLRI